MNWVPKKLSRKTNHAKPKCQLYQPGFNAGNGCWLCGRWVTVPDKGFAAAAKAHEALYAKVGEEMKKQHHRGKGVSPKKMTPAQRQAWEFFSGEGRVEVRWPNGAIGLCGVNLAADKPDAASVRWLRNKKAKVLLKVVNPDKTITDQSEDWPADMLSDDKEPVNTWKNIVKQNRDSAREMSLALADAPFHNPPLGTINGRNFNDFAVQLSMHELTELEETVVQLETGHLRDDLESMDEVKVRYVELRAELEKKLGDRFQAAYDSAKASHNECARINLDNSDGRLFCFVLPRFNPDGTHDPVGPRDIPWNRKD